MAETMESSPYTIDVDIELVPGRGYAATYVIHGADGAVMHRRLLARRFAAYSEAMVVALDAAKATVATLPGLTRQPQTAGTRPITPVALAPHPAPMVSESSTVGGITGLGW